MYIYVNLILKNHHVFRIMKIKYFYLPFSYFLTNKCRVTFNPYYSITTISILEFYHINHYITTQLFLRLWTKLFRYAGNSCPNNLSWAHGRNKGNRSTEIALFVVQHTLYSIHLLNQYFSRLISQYDNTLHKSKFRCFIHLYVIINGFVCHIKKQEKIF